MRIQTVNVLRLIRRIEISELPRCHSLFILHTIKNKLRLSLLPKIYTILSLLILSGPVFSDSTPFADIHLHFNWDQKEIISAQQVVKRLQDNNVVLATVSSTPTELAAYLIHSPDGVPRIRRIIIEDIEFARNKGDQEQVKKLKGVLMHFISTHPDYSPGVSA